jgi:hypothetical protein
MKAERRFLQVKAAKHRLSETTSEQEVRTNDADHRRAGQSGGCEHDKLRSARLRTRTRANKVLKEVKEKVEELKKIAGATEEAHRGGERGGE